MCMSFYFDMLLRLIVSDGHQTVYQIVYLLKGTLRANHCLFLKLQNQGRCCRIVVNVSYRCYELDVSQFEIIEYGILK